MKKFIFLSLISFIFTYRSDQEICNQRTQAECLSPATGAATPSDSTCCLVTAKYKANEMNFCRAVYGTNENGKAFLRNIKDAKKEIKGYDLKSISIECFERFLKPMGILLALLILF